jgi:hypothetical protein
LPEPYLIALLLHPKPGYGQINHNYVRAKHPNESPPLKMIVEDGLFEYKDVI